jgi:hypothetical protein
MNAFELTVIAASVISGTIGFLTAAFLSGAKRTRIEKTTWAAAERYYKRRYQLRDTAL